MPRLGVQSYAAERRARRRHALVAQHELNLCRRSVKSGRSPCTMQPSDLTPSSADADAKRSRLEELTIQVLMVEVESFVPEAKPAEKKEQAKSDSP